MILTSPRDLIAELEKEDDPAHEHLLAVLRDYCDATDALDREMRRLVGERANGLADKLAGRVLQ